MPSARHEIIRAAFAAKPRLVADLVSDLLAPWRRALHPDQPDLQLIPAKDPRRPHRLRRVPGSTSHLERGASPSSVWAAPSVEASRMRLAPGEAAALSIREHRADLVFLLADKAGVAQRVIVVEIQLWSDDEKSFVWPHYATTFRLIYRCPCDVVVVAPKLEVARSAQRQLRLGARHFFRPLVLGPQWFPAITDLDQAKENLELAVCSVLAHGHGARGFDVARAAFLAVHASESITEDQRVLYSDIILEALPKDVALRMEAFMRLRAEDLRSDYFKRQIQQSIEQGIEQGVEQGRMQGIEQGRMQGSALATARNILRLLDKRGLSLSDAQRARILSCQDLPTLERWFDRALEVEDVQELLD